MTTLDGFGTYELVAIPLGQGQVFNPWLVR